MKFLKSFIDLIYPNICPGCGSSMPNKQTSICVSCWGSLPRTYQYKNKQNHTAKLFWGRYPLEHAFSTFKYDKKGIVQNIIHDLKYRDNTKAGEDLGKEIGKELLEINLDVDVIIPVPLHPLKLQKRGYNQSYAIALGIQEIIKKPVDIDTLIRVVNTDSQTRKSKFERYENVHEIFDITNNECLKGLHVLLVDDVITTGSTLEGCCITLSKISGVRISVAAIASA